MVEGNKADGFKIELTQISANKRIKELFLFCFFVCRRKTYVAEGNKADGFKIELTQMGSK